MIKDFSYKQFFTLPIITRKNSICHLKNGILVNKLIFNQSAKNKLYAQIWHRSVLRSRTSELVKISSVWQFKMPKTFSIHDWFIKLPYTGNASMVAELLISSQMYF